MLQGTHSSRNSSPNSGTSHHQDIVRVIRGVSSQEDKCFSSLSFNIYPILSRLPVSKNIFSTSYPLEMGLKAPTHFTPTITVSLQIRMAPESKPQDKQAVVLAAYPKALKWSLTVRAAGLRHSQKLNFY